MERTSFFGKVKLTNKVHSLIKGFAENEAQRHVLYSALSHTYWKEVKSVLHDFVLEANRVSGRNHDILIVFFDRYFDLIQDDLDIPINRDMEYKDKVNIVWLYSSYIADRLYDSLTTNNN